MRVRHIAWLLVILLAVTVAVFIWYSQFPLIDRVEVPAPASFDPALVEEGARLAAIGNCHYCHTTKGEADFAGGRAIPTPFGAVYSSNITPAPGTGIGHWSEAAFVRAMRQGISRRGQHLYPAFPYDHFTQIDDKDLRALYAFLMTRRPAENFLPDNELPFPLSGRWVMAFWNLLFFDEAQFRPDPEQSDDWNRGAYLVAGLGHCGDCHTPRNFLGGEKTGQALSGGEAEGWKGPALNASSPAPIPWDAEQLFRYLRDGWDPAHGAAAGPMQPVIHELAGASDADIRAIAVYLAAQQKAPSGKPKQPAAPSKPAPGGGELGATIFAGACAECHTGSTPMVPPHGIELSNSSALGEPEPRNAIMIVLDGIHPKPGQAGPWMPSFAHAFTDKQLAALLQYLRVNYGPGTDWPDLAKKVGEARKIREGS
jgi:mono/diheme cytochrome c family protein